MQGVVQSCVTCGVRYAMQQSTWKSFRDASEMCWKSAESDMQGCTLTLIHNFTRSQPNQIQCNYPHWILLDEGFPFIYICINKVPLPHKSCVCSKSGR